MVVGTWLCRTLGLVWSMFDVGAPLFLQLYYYVYILARLLPLLNSCPYFWGDQRYYYYLYPMLHICLLPPLYVASTESAAVH